MFNKLKSWIIYLAIVFSYGTGTQKKYNLESLNRLLVSSEPFIVATWHGNLLGLMYFLRHKSFTGLVSKSSDGDIIVGAARLFGYDFIRGSSSDGGNLALRQTIKHLHKSGSRLFITPDGPRGPEHKVKPGVVSAAILTGAPILPIIFKTNKSWVFKNWHHFYFAKPFTKKEVVVGNPIFLNKNDKIDASCKRVEDSLNDLLAGGSKNA